MIVSTGGNAFALVHEHKNGWNAEAFKERYSDVLDRYDYIVGDWGYSQLRLRGFYAEGHPRATKDSTIAGLVDYLNEYCNFGCAYFVLSKTDAAAIPPGADLGAPADEQPEPGADAAAVSAASSEAAAQAAETAATAGGSVAVGGVLMRWPLKERLGGPVRVPGASAVARAAQEAERRQQQAAAASGKPADSRSGRQGADAGGTGRPGSRSYGGASDRHSAGGQAGGGAYSADGRSGGKPQGQRSPRPQGSERAPAGGGMSGRPDGHGRPVEPGRPADASHGADAGRERPDGGKNGSRWQGKNRRRNRFGGKPGRPDGAPRDGGGSRPDAGNHSGD